MARVLYSHNLKQYLPPGPYGPAYKGESVGLDLYAVEGRRIYPSNQLENTPAGEAIVSANTGVFSLSKGQVASQLIPTGIHLILGDNEVGLILERGSVTKTPLKVRAGVIDPGFTGEIFVNCVNLDIHPYEIMPGMKLPFQLVVTPVVRPTTTLVDDIDAELSRIKTLRGAGQVGSSDQVSYLDTNQMYSF
jgi:dUTPase